MKAAAVSSPDYDFGHASQDERPMNSTTALMLRNGDPGHIRRSFTHRIRRQRDDWTVEVASLILSVAAFAALVGILAAYHNHPLSTFGSSTTINAIISMLITVSEFSLLYPVSEAICQQKWIHMHRSQTSGRPIIDLQKFDRAAYSGYAALDLLSHGRSYGATVLLGTTAIIAHLFIGPFAQQAVSYPTRSTAQLGGYENATIARAESFNGTAYQTTLQTAVKAAVDSTWTHATSSLDYTCPSANCSWDPFATLAVCSKCVDVTSDLQQECAGQDASASSNGEFRSCNAVFPSGYQVPMLDGSYYISQCYDDSCDATTINASASFQNLPISAEEEHCPLTDGFRETMGNIALPFITLDLWQSGFPRMPAAGHECALYLCIQEYSNVAVVNGSLQSGNASELQPLSVAIDTSASPSLFYWPFPDDATITLYHEGGDPNGTSYTVDTTVLGYIATEIFDIFQSGGIGIEPAWLNSYTTWSNQHWTSSDYSTGHSSLASDMLAAVAEAVTVTMRNLPGSIADRRPAQGTSWAPVVFIEVHWAWLACPAAVILLAVVFVVTTIVQNSRFGLPVWKSSTLANIYHGPMLVDSADAAGLDRVSVMQDDAATCVVRLRRTGSGRLRLLPMPQSVDK